MGVWIPFNYQLYRTVSGDMTNRLTASLGRWMSAVRKISAANAFLVAMDVKLDKANKALMRTFQVWMTTRCG